MELSCNQSVKDRIMLFISKSGITKSVFERKSGLSNGYLNQLRNTPKEDKISNILKAYPEINRVWLLTGEGEMLMKQSPAEDVSEDIIDKEYTTYLLPLSAMAGQLSGLSADGVFLSECEKIISPIKGVDFAITIYGDSMHPEYPSGSRILIKKINPDIFIEWGKVYVLDTDNGVIVKEIHKCENKENYITCHSINPDPKFADFDVNINEIHGMYRVLMCLSAK